MRRTTGLACLLWLLAAAPALAAPLQDVLGREVPLGQGRPALVLYANRGSGGVLRAHAYDFAYALREERPIVVVRVDLRDVPGVLRGVARRELRKKYAESLASMRHVFLSHGQTPPAELEQSLFMVAEPGGESHQALGLEEGARRVMAQVVSPRGQELARGAFPEATPRLERALEAAVPPLSARRGAE